MKKLIIFFVCFLNPLVCTAREAVCYSYINQLEDSRAQQKCASQSHDKDIQKACNVLNISFILGAHGMTTEPLTDDELHKYIETITGSQEESVIADEMGKYKTLRAKLQKQSHNITITGAVRDPRRVVKPKKKPSVFQAKGQQPTDDEKRRHAEQVEDY